MTTKPKAQNYRVRRMSRSNGTSDTVEPIDSPEPSQKELEFNDKLFDDEGKNDGFGDEPFPGSSAHAKARPTAVSRRASRGAISDALEKEVRTENAENNGSDEARTVDEEIENIKREGLTGRQLRMARRVAQKHGITPENEFDAVRLLRKQGIDPFKRSTMLEVAKTENDANLPATSNNTLPASADVAPQLPPELLDRMSRESEISQIQKDIAKRRRRKTALLVSRLLVFVGIPTLLCGIYFYTIATPMYATNSSFMIQQAEPSATGGGAGLLSSSPLSGAFDSIAVQDYLESRDAMLRLDADVGFKEHFSDASIDPVQRLSENPSNEEAFKAYSSHVKIGYDPTEGLVKLEVVATDPHVSQKFSEALIKYAEERVDNLTLRKREDQMKGAREGLQEAEIKLQETQEAVVKLQEQIGMISPEAETGALMSQISRFEGQLQVKQLELQQLLDNRRPNQARVEGVQGDIRRIESVVAELRSQLTVPTETSGSLARISLDLKMAELDLQMRQAMAQQALQALEGARVEANRQTRFLSLSSSPIAPDEPTYPRKFENTVLSFLLFSGLYLLASLTAAVLREQMSS